MKISKKPALPKSGNDILNKPKPSDRTLLKSQNKTDGDPLITSDNLNQKSPENDNKPQDKMSLKRKISAETKIVSSKRNASSSSLNRKSSSRRNSSCTSLEVRKASTAKSLSGTNSRRRNNCQTSSKTKKSSSKRPSKTSEVKKSKLKTRTESTSQFEPTSSSSTEQPQSSPSAQRSSPDLLNNSNSSTTQPNPPSENTRLGTGELVETHVNASRFSTEGFTLPISSVSENHSLPIDPPSYDEVLETNDSDSPPYREKLHKHLDLLSFDPRYSIPVLRINKKLIKTHSRLEKSMWKLKEYNILPLEINLWDLRQVDDRCLYKIIPELLDFATEEEQQQIELALYLSLHEEELQTEPVRTTLSSTPILTQTPLQTASPVISSHSHPYRIYQGI